MKRILSIILLALFLSVGVGASGAVEAAKIHITNQNGNTVSVAVHYYDTENGKWRTRGWYNVKPNSTRDVNFSGIGSEVYLHAYMGSIKWGNGDAVQSVRTKSAFDYYGDSKNCPNGSDRQPAKFTRFKVVNGVVNYKPTASN